MSEPEEENQQTVFPPKSKELPTVVEREYLMDLDLDLDSSWPLDQIPLVSNPMSPFLFSSSEQPCSPLWAFSDAGDDDKLAGNVYSTLPGGFRISDYPRFRSLNSANTDQVNESPMEDDDRRRLPPLMLGLTPLEADGSCVIKERMTQALRYFKESTEQHVLAQIWAPVKNGSKYVLTTSGQPFFLDPHSSGLNQYRMVSLMYMFSVDGENDGELGLPGRVFCQKLPEWTPNVQYYTSQEYSRLDHALHYNVRGTLALPVFEPSGQSCVGILELILTSQKINYATEVDKVYKALELNVELNDNGRQQALVVAERLCLNPKISVVYTSDLMSSVVAAHIIASRCGGAKVIEDPDLRERHYGDLQGLKYKEFEIVSPEAYNAFRISWRSDNFEDIGPDL